MNAKSSIDPDNQAVFMNAVEVAKVAYEAHTKCIDAQNRLDTIENLYQQAKEEYENINDVAASLAATATAVATVALKMCAYSSCREAFNSSSKYAEKMNFDDFMSVVSLGDSKKNRTGGTSPKTDSSVTSRDGYNSSKSHNGNSGSPGADHVHDLHNVSGNIGKDKHVKSSFKPLSDILPGHRRRRSLPSEESLSTFFKSPDRSELASTTSSKDFASEKYPKGVAPSEYKESLEETFHTSITSMTPLWEDRYIDVPRIKSKDASGSGGVTSDPTTWSEKKLLKQFQIKMQHVAPLDLCSDEDTDVMPRPVNPTPPENPRRLTPYITSPPPPAQDTLHRSPHTHDNDDSDEENYDDAQEALDDSKDNEIASLFKRQFVSNVRAVDERQTETQRLNVPQSQKKRPVSPLLNRVEKDYYGVVLDDSLSQQKRHVFQLKNSKPDD